MPHNILATLWVSNFIGGKAKGRDDEAYSLAKTN